MVETDSLVCLFICGHVALILPLWVMAVDTERFITHTLLVCVDRSCVWLLLTSYITVFVVSGLVYNSTG